MAQPRNLPHGGVRCDPARRKQDMRRQDLPRTSALQRTDFHRLVQNGGLLRILCHRSWKTFRFSTHQTWHQPALFLCVWSNEVVWLGWLAGEESAMCVLRWPQETMTMPVVC